MPLRRPCTTVLASAGLVLAGGLPLLAAAPASADIPLPPDCIEKTYDGFAGATDLTFNGDAHVVATADGSVLRVTHAASGQSGSAFTTTQVRLLNDGSFSTAFSFRFSGQTNGGADGLVFTVQNVDDRAGGAGGGIGYQGLSPSVGVELDNWDNGRPGDPSNNHVGIDVDGNMTSDPVQDLNPLGINLDDGQVKYAWVDYDGSSNQLEVRLATSDVRPAAALLTKNIDVPHVLGDVDNAFIGFTSGTGAAWANHDVISWSFRNCYQPLGVDRSPVADAGGPYDGPQDTATPLNGSVADDDPTVAPTAAWTGPTGCTFADATSPTTSITCDQPGDYTITLTATDSKGQTTSDDATVHVTDRAPVAGALTLTPSGPCGVEASLAWTDPDTGDAHTASFGWGDGSGATAGTVSESAGTATASHTYAHAGTYTVSATVSDGSESDTRTGSWTNRNAADDFLPPINANGSRDVFKLGSTIPVKVVVRDCDGATVTDLSPVVQVDRGTGPVDPAAVLEAATNGKAMRWDGGHYQYNLSTKNSRLADGSALVPGTYRITVTDPSLASTRSVVVDLR